MVDLSNRYKGLSSFFRKKGWATAKPALPFQPTKNSKYFKKGTNQWYEIYWESFKKIRKLLNFRKASHSIENCGNSGRTIKCNGNYWWEIFAKMSSFQENNEKFFSPWKCSVSHLVPVVITTIVLQSYMDLSLLRSENSSFFLELHNQELSHQSVFRKITSNSRIVFLRIFKYQSKTRIKT